MSKVFESPEDIVNHWLDENGIKISNKYLSIYGLDNSSYYTLPEEFGYGFENVELNKLGIGIPITTLPESIGAITSLVEIRIENNGSLIEIPQSIGDLLNLKIFHVNGNLITELPESIGNLKSLTHFGCNNNKLTTFPESFGNLSSLINLYCSGNNFESLPDSLKNLSSLTHVYCEQNLISLFKSVINKNIIYH
eukprot:TRINITY_DN602_c0_g1_i2.p1 TRINITY_DN602_c0_g1~~TRINITY_DN602_c0_g1_i2.p1  ORF type:complete len:194 (-),score=33.48 TRINITY_DN602_c0_g1_i2:83-664(-)